MSIRIRRRCAGSRGGSFLNVLLFHDFLEFRTPTMSQQRAKACTYVRLTELLLIITAFLVFSISYVNKDILLRTLQTSHSSTGPEAPGIRFWVHRYSAWHQKHRHNASRRVVFRPIGAGLGDSIFGLVSLYGFAVLTNRLLLVDWLASYPLADVVSADAAAQFIYDRARDENSSESVHYPRALQLPDAALCREARPPARVRAHRVPVHRAAAVRHQAHAGYARRRVEGS